MLRSTRQLVGSCLCLALLGGALSCAARRGAYFGKIAPPADRALRYCTGPEIGSLDPQIGTNQSDYRIYMALFEGLTEYDPRTIEPIPGLAESWEVRGDSSEFIFHLRPNIRWSNGEPITAHDFVATIRRGLSPALASNNAYLGYGIKYAKAYNERAVFVRDPDSGRFLSEKDFSANAPEEADSPPAADDAPPENSFHHFLHEPARLTLPQDETARAKKLAADERLRVAVAGKEFVPVRAEDIGVEAADDATLRIVLGGRTPYFLGLTSHPFFRAVPRQMIEGDAKKVQSAGPAFVSSGAFKLESWELYDRLVVVKNPLYWDAARVQLEKIIFYPLDELTTAMNLYKAGEIDAIGNHYVPAGWVEAVRPFRDYQDEPELAIQYYLINVTKPPMNDVRVRKAFNLAIDKFALAASRRTVKPITAFTPPGLFPGYESPRGDDFDPARAVQLLAEAGFRDERGAYDSSKFPVAEVEIAANVVPSNREVAEFIQAQWKQNLGITVPIRMMESKTINAARARLEYKGLTRNGFAADYLDPFTFLNIFTAPNNGTGWFDARYNAMLERANRAATPAERFRLLAEAEKHLIDAQPVIPLYSSATNAMKKPYVQGLYPNPGMLHAWKFVRIEPDPTKWE